MKQQSGFGSQLGTSPIHECDDRRKASSSAPRGLFNNVSIIDESAGHHSTTPHLTDSGDGVAFESGGAPVSSMWESCQVTTPGVEGRGLSPGGEWKSPPLSPASANIKVQTPVSTNDLSTIRRQSGRKERRDMSSIPKFHSKAIEEAESRFRAARGERDKAQSFLEELDDVLSEALSAVSGSPFSE